MDSKHEENLPPEDVVAQEPVGVAVAVTEEDMP